MSGTAGDEELWTTGQAAEYLSCLGVSSRQVARLVDRGELVGVQTGRFKWRRVLASSVRTYRQQIMDQLSRAGLASRNGDAT